MAYMNINLTEQQVADIVTVLQAQAVRAVDEDVKEYYQELAHQFLVHLGTVQQRKQSEPFVLDAMAPDSLCE